MISPFEVYLVMQLDNVGKMFGIAFGILLVAVVLTAICFFSAKAARCDDDADSAWNIGKKLLWPFVIVATVGTLIPSSKTAAAMIILPALTSKEVTEPLAAEGKELYALAKQALRDAVDAKDEKPEPSK